MTPSPWPNIMIICTPYWTLECLEGSGSKFSLYCWSERSTGKDWDIRGQHSAVLGETRTNALQHRSTRGNRSTLRATGALPSSVAATALPRQPSLQLVHLLRRQGRSTLADHPPTFWHEEDHADNRRVPHCTQLPAERPTGRRQRGGKKQASHAHLTNYWLMFRGLFLTL